MLLPTTLGKPLRNFSGQAWSHRVWRSVLWSLLLASGCGKEEPRYYETQDTPTPPVQTAPLPTPPPSNPGGTNSDAEAPFVHRVPAGWMAQPPSSMVLLSWQTAQAPQLVATVTVSVFPGDVGGQLANMNRWRRQVGLGPISAEAGEAFSQPATVSGLTGWRVDFTGPAEGSSDGLPSRLLAVAVPHEGTTWFFKMAGPASAVEEQVTAFESFLQSIQLP